MDSGDIHRVSRFLSRHLDNIHGIGTEETVKVRRLITHLRHNFTMPQTDIISVQCCGSAGEGLRLPGSDMDSMFVYNCVIVLQPDDDVHPGDGGKTILVMDDTDCRPGVTLLRLHDRGVRPLGPVIDALVDMNGSLYLSSLVFNSNTLMPSDYLHGPCSTSTIGVHEYDLARGFHYQSWPDGISDFRNRTRHYGWPPRYLVNDIVRQGCHLVAIGDKLSPLAAMQWRISFTNAEKRLIHSFNHTQFKTYALLKIFLKQCIEQDDSVKDLLCSYFMKTIVIHAVENSPSSMWVDKHTLFCFWFCFTILLHNVYAGYLANYFVPTNNMFLVNVTGDNKRNLLRVLSRYHNMGWTCLFQCPTLQSLHQTLLESCDRYPSPVSAIHVECEQDYLVSNFISCIDDSNTTSITPTAVKEIYRLFSGCDDDKQLDITLCMFITAMTTISNNSIADLSRTHGNNNKVAYRRARRDKGLLHLSAAINNCQGLLSLATFYYNSGNMPKASETGIQAIFACQQGGILFRHNRDPTEYRDAMCGKDYTLLEKVKRSFVYDYKVHKDNCRLYPPELDLEAQTASAETSVDIPPLPYAIFLLILSTFRLGNIDQSRAILDDLHATTTHPLYGVYHFPVVFNLVGICHQLLGDTRLAIKSFECSCRQNLQANGNYVAKVIAKGVYLAAVIRLIAELTKPTKVRRDQTHSDTLDYCNVPGHTRGDESDDDDNDDDGDALHSHKIMYNRDPLELSHFWWC